MSSPLLPPYATSSIPSQQWVLLIRHLQPPPSGRLCCRGGGTYKNRQMGVGLSWLSGGLVTLLSLIPGAGVIDFPLSVCVAPCPVYSPAMTGVCITHMNLFQHISAGLMKCVSCNQGDASTCQMSRFARSSFSSKPLSPFLSLSLFIFFKLPLDLNTPSSLKRQKVHVANQVLPQ